MIKNILNPFFIWIGILLCGLVISNHNINGYSTCLLLLTGYYGLMYYAFKVSNVVGLSIV